jgi:hypothetical protein
MDGSLALPGTVTSIKFGRIAISCWEDKQTWYRTHGSLPLREGGGPKGALIVSEDQPDGGIDCPKINALINSIVQR